MFGGLQSYLEEHWVPPFGVSRGILSQLSMITVVQLEFKSGLQIQNELSLKDSK